MSRTGWYTDGSCRSGPLVIDYLSDTTACRLSSRHLKLILALEEHERIGLAADVLAITQPAASRLLADMERLLGVRLCERRPRGVKLTVAGRAVARRARNLLAEMHSLARDIDEMESGRGGVVRAGAVTSAAVSYLVPAIRKLRSASAGVEVCLDVAPSDSLVRDLLGGRHDFVVGRVPPGAKSARFDLHPGRTEEISVVVCRGHPLASADSVGLAELSGHDWIVQTRGSPLRESLDAAFLDVGAPPPDRVTHTSSLLVTLAMLAESPAVAAVTSVVADLLVDDEVGTGLERVRLRERIVIEPYSVLTVAGRRLSPTAERLRTLVLEGLASFPSPPAR